jgi:hypothetical protein
MIETWKAIPGFEGMYEVSDQGRVRGLDRTVKVVQRLRNGKTAVTSRYYRGQMLRPGKASHGYFTVSLSGTSYCVHDLVLSAFVGPRPEGQVCRHLDGSRTNNVIGNLCWGTQVENTADTDAHGRYLRGSQRAEAKLTEDAAREIRRLRYRVSQSVLAQRFGVSPAAVQAVHDGRTWKHA